MRTMQIIGTICIVLAAAFTIYISVIMLHRINSVVLKDTYIRVFRYELIICAVFLLLAFDLRFGFLTKPGAKVLKAAGWTIRIAAILFAAAVLFFFAKVAVGGFPRQKVTADHALVLGLALENGQPAPDLLYRLDTAEEYLKECPGGMLVLTGGNPDASGKTEAAAMNGILKERGVPKGKMLLEDKAKTTEQNFVNAAKIADPSRPVVVITNDYHMERAVSTAKKAGFMDIQRMPARSTALNYLANVVWEVIMMINELTLKKS